MKKTLSTSRQLPNRVAGVCFFCGCTADDACPGGCAWLNESTCSTCAEFDTVLKELEGQSANRGKRSTGPRSEQFYAVRCGFLVGIWTDARAFAYDEGADMLRPDWPAARRRAWDCGLEAGRDARRSVSIAQGTGSRADEEKRAAAGYPLPHFVRVAILDAAYCL